MPSPTGCVNEMWFRVEEPPGAAAETVKAKAARAMKDFILLCWEGLGGRGGEGKRMRC